MESVHCGSASDRPANDRLERGRLFDRVMFHIKILDQFADQIQQTDQWMILLIADHIQQGIQMKTLWSW